MQPSEIITVNIWQIVVSLLNLVLLFLIIKKFLYKPFKNTLKQREEKLEQKYTEASEHLAEAENTRQELEKRLENAQEQADAIVAEATANAQRHMDDTTRAATLEAEAIVERARKNAELEVKKAQSEIKTQIVDVSVALSEKLIEREIKEEDHHKLIDSFIAQIGDGDEE